MAHASDVVSTPPQTPVTTTGAPYWAPSSAAPVQDLPAGLVSNGSLGIKERRSWATWQLVSIAFVALLGGMLVEYLASGSGGSSSASKVNAKSYTPPPPSRSSSSGTASPGGKTGSTTTTSTAPGAGAGQTTSTTAPVTGPAQVLLGPYLSLGDWTSPSFTIGGGQWNIGWAYRCTPAPAAGPAFQIFVFPTGGSPSGTPAVSQTADSGQSVTPQTTSGSQQLQVQVPAGCIWVVKVTGVG